LNSELAALLRVLLHTFSVRENRVEHRQDPVRRTIMMPTGKHSPTMFTGPKQGMYHRTLIDRVMPQPVLEAGHQTCGKAREIRSIVLN